MLIMKERIRKILREETFNTLNKENAERGKLSDVLENLTIDFLGKENICDLIAMYASGTYVIMVLYNGVSKWDLQSKLDQHLRSYIPVNLFSMITDRKCDQN